MNEYTTLTCEDIAALFGFGAETVAAANEALLSRMNLRCRTLPREQRDGVVLDALRCVYEEELRQVGEHRQGIWESCWGGLKEDVEQDAFGLAKLAPEFMKGFRFFRLAGDFVEPEDPDLFYGLTRALLRTVYADYRRDASSLYEFGCGSGHNLLPFIDMYPAKPCVGLDWSASAADLVNGWGAIHGFKASGRTFDFFKPDYGLDLAPGAAILTCTALEQVHDRHTAFLDFMLAKKPGLCIHIEPIFEYYDRDELLDHLAAAYHAKRRYLTGFLPALRALEAQDRIRIAKTQRVRLGNIYNECFSYVIWQVL